MARNQLKVLHALDVARTQWYHFTAIVIAGMGFFTDAFDLFSISLITDLLGRIYYDDGNLPISSSANILSSAFYGAVLGQLFFGWLGDKMGRKRIYGVTLKLMAVCSLASGLSFRRTAKSIITTLCFFRFWLGFGIGGDYPLSATIMSEYANKRTRGTFIAAVFAMQGLGNFSAGIVGVIVSAAFRNTAAYGRDSRDQADYVWRIILMSGAIPALLTYYLRMQMPETARYTALVTKNAEQATLDMSTVLNVDIEPEPETQPLTKRDEFGLFSAEFLKRHGLHLMSTTVCWLVLDVTFYSLNLFMKDIFTDVGWFGHGDAMSPLEQTFKIASTQALIAVVGTLPGYFFTVALVDRIGRIKIQLLGFTMMTAFMLGLAIPYQYWAADKKKSAFGAMYALIFFFANFGPNSTTFIIPAEIFPARLRSTCHGVSGAGGKIGAIVGVFVSLYVAIRTSSDNERRIEIEKLLYILVGCNMVGLVFTLLLPESMGKSLEEITGEIEGGEPPEDTAAATVGTEDVRTVPI